MKDKTLIILALMFLVLTIGTGVNTSLEACNKMMGSPMAPTLTDLFDKNKPILNEEAANIRLWVSKIVNRVI
jgi:hypothetical protein